MMGGMPRGDVRNLTPFTSEQASLMAKRSHEMRRRRRAEGQRQALTRNELMKLKLDDLPSREEVGTMASKAALDILQRYLLGEIPVRNATEATRFLEVAHAITRLEEGRATAITEHLSPEDRHAMLAELRAAVEARGLRAVE